MSSERPPNHYVCWCGTVVSPSRLGGSTLYETTGDVHKCAYRATPEPPEEPELHCLKCQRPLGPREVPHCPRCGLEVCPGCIPPPEPPEEPAPPEPEGGEATDDPLEITEEDVRAFYHAHAIRSLDRDGGMGHREAAEFIRDRLRARLTRTPTASDPGRCPTCGGPVEIDSSDEGTRYYRPAPTARRVSRDRLHEIRQAWRDFEVQMVQEFGEDDLKPDQDDLAYTFHGLRKAFAEIEPEEASHDGA